MYIQRGGVKVSAVATSGREAVVALLGPGDFLGEGCLAGEATRMRRATAMTPITIGVVANDAMIRLLRRRPVSHRLLSPVLVRHAIMEQALIDQFFSSMEKRLARTLLLLARYGTREAPQRAPFTACPRRHLPRRWAQAARGSPRSWASSGAGLSNTTAASSSTGHFCALCWSIFGADDLMVGRNTLMPRGTRQTRPPAIPEDWKL
jgi:hypothetical protein